MVQLNRSMMERYEIADHRPGETCAAIFGADRLMLGAVARLLDGAGLGALCITPAAAALEKQDGMFTLLVRGEEDGKDVRREQVVQSILRALDPDGDFEEMLLAAARPEMDLLFLPLHAAAVEIALAARYLYARWQAGCAAPEIILAAEDVLPEEVPNLRAGMIALSAAWADNEAFAAWLQTGRFHALLCEGMSAPLNEAERARALHDMNYRDDFIAWAEPMLKCTLQGGAPQKLAGVLCKEDFESACLKKERVFDSVVFLCAVSGFLSGKDTYAQVLKDEKLRAWIGRAFFEEILPALPYAREAVAPDVISAFSRLENSSNDVPLMEIGRGLLGRFPRTLLPAIRAWADREFEAPPRLSLALSAAIMIYAGARKNSCGAYEILRGDQTREICDDASILEAFSRLSHDMPAESLAYAALADRDIWGCDLREVDGLEMRVAFDLSSIQRIGFGETLRLQEEN